MIATLTTAFLAVSTLFWLTFLVVGFKEQPAQVVMWPRAVMALWAAASLAGRFA